MGFRKSTLYLDAHANTPIGRARLALTGSIQSQACLWPSLSCGCLAPTRSSQSKNRARSSRENDVADGALADAAIWGDVSVDDTKGRVKGRAVSVDAGRRIRCSEKAHTKLFRVVFPITFLSFSTMNSSYSFYFILFVAFNDL